MVISRRLYGLCMLLAVTFFAAASVSAQMLPLLNSFRSRTFDGTVDVSWPVEFDGCTFLTDSVVLSHSYGAVFRNCRFESRSGKLYLAENGSGMIMSGCEITGCDGFSFSRHPEPTDRNYVTDVNVNGSVFGVRQKHSSTSAASVNAVMRSPLRRFIKPLTTASYTRRCLRTVTIEPKKPMPTPMAIAIGASDV